MAFGDNVSIQIFPSLFFSDRNEDIFVFNVERRSRFLYQGFPLFHTPNNSLVRAEYINTNSDGNDKLQFSLSFSSAVVIYPGMLIEIKKSAIEEYNGRWRVGEVSLDKTVIKLIKKKSFSNTSGLNHNNQINLGDSIEFSIPPIGMEIRTVASTTHFFDKEDEITFSILGRTDGFQIAAHSGFASPFVSFFIVRDKLRYCFFGNRYGLGCTTRRRERTTGELYSYHYSYIGKFTDIYSGFLYLQDQDYGVNYQTINPFVAWNNTNIKYPYLHLLNNKGENFLGYSMQEHVLVGKFGYMLSPHMWKNNIRSSTTIATYPWFISDSLPSQPFKIPGAVALFKYEPELENAGLHLTTTKYNGKDTINTFYTLAEPDYLMERPLVTCLDDEYWEILGKKDQVWY